MSRVVRWRLKLAKYEYEIVYKAGKINLNVEKRGGRINCGKNLQKPTVKLLFPFVLNENSDSTSALASPTKTISPRQSHDIPEDATSLMCDEIINESDTELDDSSEDSDFPLSDFPLSTFLLSMF